MTLHQLKVFLTIVKLNGVAQAAKALHISQPSVSGVVQDLQNELGVKLFERLGNKRQLTEIGRRLFERAQSSIAAIEGIKEDIDEMKGVKRGKISVGSSGIGTILILPAVQEFKKLYPGVEMSLAFQDTDLLHQRLLDGDIDVAIMGHSPISPLIVAEPYCEEEVVFIAPPNHPLIRKRSVPLKLLAKEPLIVFKSGFFREMLAQKFTEAGFPFKPLMEINLQLGSRDAIKGAVANGLGISYLTKRHLIGDLKAGHFKVIRVPEFEWKRTVYIAVHKNREVSPSARAFIDFLKSYRRRRSP